VLPAGVLVVLGVVVWSGNGNGGEIAAGSVLVALGVIIGAATGGFTADELSSAVRSR
jgi:hypothetical protein